MDKRKIYMSSLQYKITIPKILSTLKFNIIVT